MDRYEERYEERADVRRSVLLVSAAFGLAAGLYLVRLETLADELTINVLGGAIAAVSALSVFVQRQWTGVVVVAIAITTTLVLLSSDFHLTSAVASAIFAAMAGMMIMAALRTRDD